MNGKSSFETERQISEGATWLGVGVLLLAVSLMLVGVGYKAVDWLPAANPSTVRGTAQGGR